MYGNDIHQEEAHGAGKATLQGHKTSRQMGHFPSNSKSIPQLKEQGTGKTQTTAVLYE
jgi:hypothetical protein